MMEDKIGIIIKAANQTVDDYIIECDSSCTVLQLKKQLCEKYLLKPKIEEQRIIHAGQLLPDHIILKSVLRHPQENNLYTVHLVCLTPHVKSSRLPNIVDSSSENVLNTDGLRRRHAHTPDTSAPSTQNVDDSPICPPSFPSVSFSDSTQQLASMQQMYAQYMASYMQYLQMGSVGETGLIWPQQIVFDSLTNPSASSVESVSAEQNAVRETADPPNAPQAERNQPAAAPQMWMNAQGGEVFEDAEDEEGNGGDWLDLVYQTGWFRPARRVETPVVPRGQDDDERNNNIQNNNNNNDVPPEIVQVAEEAVPQVEEIPPDDIENVLNDENVPFERPSILTLSWAFLSGFFTSLIPEQPQVI